MPQSKEFASPESAVVPADEAVSGRKGGDLARFSGGSDLSPIVDQGAPVFVCSSFRTSSTWLWAKLRAAPNTIAYCEIFNEALATLDIKQASGLSYSTWNSKHPHAAPYFLEFAPL